MLDTIMDPKSPAAGRLTCPPASTANDHHSVAFRAWAGYDAHVTTEAKRVLHAALQLPAHEREELVARLEESLDEPMPEQVEACWIEEVERRIADIDSGKATLVSSESARRTRSEILERAQARRID